MIMLSCNPSTRETETLSQTNEVELLEPSLPKVTKDQEVMKNDSKAREKGE